jgi:hypothetical protein
MDVADKLMNLAVDGDTGEELVVRTDDDNDDELVEETKVTRTVRRGRTAPDKVIIVED